MSLRSGVALHVSRWGEYGPPPEICSALDDAFAAMKMTVQVPIRAAPLEVWKVITDIQRIGEFSPECVEAWWVSGSPARAVGGRFEGRNRRVTPDDVFEWIRPCDVVTYDPPREFSWTVGNKYDGAPATTWTYRVEAAEHGVVLEQRFQHLAHGLSGLRMAAEKRPQEADRVLDERRANLLEGMRETLDRVRAAVER